MKVSEIIKFLNKRFPLHLQEQYDNSGDQISFAEEEINGILLSLDLNAHQIDESQKKGCNMIVTHHPFFFNPVKRIRSGEPKSDFLLRLIDNRITLYSAHTNMDKIYFDKLAEMLGVINKEILVRTDLSESDDTSTIGFGVYGEFSDKITLADLLTIIKERLKLDFLLFSGELNKSIKRVAVINGSGGGFITRILQDKTLDCIVTGDVGYHHSMAALDHGVAVIDAGHYGTERILLNYLHNDLLDYLTEIGLSDTVEIHISDTESNPFRVKL